MGSSSLLVTHIEETLRESALSYVYIDYTDKNTHSVENIAANLLKQLVARFDEIPQDLLQVFEKRRKDWTRLKSKELGEWILKCVEYHCSIFIILDGLDEYGSMWAQRSLVSFLVGLQGDRVRIFVTSRHAFPQQLEAVPVMEAVPVIEVSAKESDIIEYVRTKLTYFRSATRRNESLAALEARIVMSIASKANGM
jgi:hypothetical protein